VRALIASGTGRYADPWHPFPRTSPLIAGVLHEAGFDVEIDHDVDHAMTRLIGVDLLVVNAGDPWRSEEPAEPPADAIAGLAHALHRGLGILAVHCAVASMRDYPDWHPAIGGMWVPTLSDHPPADETTIAGVGNPEHITIEPFAVFDERYCRIQRLGSSTVVARHDSIRGSEPTAWVRNAGPSRVAVDLLGHDERSYDSPGRRALMAELAVWTARPAEQTP
jgi:type 1 glutamine amidotransferase